MRFDTRKSNEESFHFLNFFPHFLQILDHELQMHASFRETNLFYRERKQENICIQIYTQGEFYDNNRVYVLSQIQTKHAPSSLRKWQNSRTS